jgi:tetratricopeptide (TPR) repeat protein
MVDTNRIGGVKMGRIILIFALILSFSPIGIMLFGKYLPSSKLEREAKRLSDEGVLLLEKGNYKEAEKRFLKAIKTDPDDAEHLNNLATLYELSERKKEAFIEYEKSAKLARSQLQQVIAKRGIKRNQGVEGEMKERL